LELSNHLIIFIHMDELQKKYKKEFYTIADNIKKKAITLNKKTTVNTSSNKRVPILSER